MDSSFKISQLLEVVCTYKMVFMVPVMDCLRYLSVNLEDFSYPTDAVLHRVTCRIIPVSTIFSVTTGALERFWCKPKVRHRVRILPPFLLARSYIFCSNETM